MGNGKTHDQIPILQHHVKELIEVHENHVLDHPIWSPNEKVTPFGRSQHRSG